MKKEKELLILRVRGKWSVLFSSTEEQSLSKYEIQPSPLIFIIINLYSADREPEYEYVLTLEINNK